MAGQFFFAWVAPGTPFNPSAHNVLDEEIVSFRITQSEGDFASLEIDTINPGEGLLAPGRQPWCWLSYGNGTPEHVLFHGRLVGVTQDINGESVRLLLIARPLNFEDTKTALAESLKILPYWDPVWITGDLDDPDAVLNTYGRVWHIDPVTLAITTTDELVGEDGTVILDPEDLLYDNLEVTYTEPPLSKVKIDATLTWTQGGTGQINLTNEIYSKFREGGSIYDLPGSGVISTLSGDGLINSWPKGGTNFGGGWTVSKKTYAETATPGLVDQTTYTVKWQAPNPARTDEETGLPITGTMDPYWVQYEVEFEITAVKQESFFDWEADRGRTENLQCTVAADIQPLLAEPDDDDNILTITVAANDTVTEDLYEATIPIVDIRRKSYLNTSRGAASVEHLFLLARAELRRRARAVDVSVRTHFESALGVTLRRNAQITDPRIPGGIAVGKITGYEFGATAGGERYCQLTIGCSIGRGGEALPPAGGTPTYVDVGYVDVGYQLAAGAQAAIPTDDIVYQSLDAFEIDDDGVDLLTLDEKTAVVELVIENTPSDQVDAVTPDDSLRNIDPIVKFRTNYTRICLQLVEVAGMDFETTFNPSVESMPIPQTIDLEAGA